MQTSYAISKVFVSMSLSTAQNAICYMLLIRNSGGKRLAGALAALFQAFTFLLIYVSELISHQAGLNAPFVNK